jgi:hypothetical protein
MIFATASISVGIVPVARRDAVLKRFDELYRRQAHEGVKHDN